MDTVWQDIRYGVRTLLRKPGFAVVAVITLALGIGANTAIFSVINGVILRQLPYKDAGRLTIIWNDFGEQGQSLPSVSPGDFLDYQERAQLFEEFASAGGGPPWASLTGDGDPEQVDQSAVSSNSARAHRSGKQWS